MKQVMLDIPDELAERLRPYWNDLARILQLGLGQAERQAPEPTVTPRERAIRLLKEKRLAHPLDERLARGYLASPHPRVRTAPIQAGGQPASEWIIEQRGPR